MDNVIEIAFFVIAMLVAFVHWLVKESGVFKKKESDEERRKLVEQMEARNQRRQEQAPPSRGGDQQAADWRALREALGLPADAQPPGQESRPQPPPLYRAPEPDPRHRHYEDSSDPECDDDLEEEEVAKPPKVRGFKAIDVFEAPPEPETEGPARKVEEFAPLNEREMALIRAIRARGGSTSAEALAFAEEDLREDFAYEPTTAATSSKGKRPSAAAKASRPMSRAGSDVRRLLRDRNGIRQAVLAREILGPPKAWRE
jgi:hypothetical protein